MFLNGIKLLILVLFINRLFFILYIIKYILYYIILHTICNQTDNNVLKNKNTILNFIIKHFKT